MSLERTYQGLKIVVATGDLIRQKVDAIVNPANSLMVMGGGVAGAIKRSGARKSRTKPSSTRQFPSERPWQPELEG